MEIISIENITHIVLSLSNGRTQHGATRNGKNGEIAYYGN